MKKEIRYAFFILSMGAGLVAYAHGNFVSKPMMQLMYDKLTHMDDKLDKLIFHYKKIK